MKKIQYILLASLAIGAGASAASLPEEAAAMAEQFLSQKWAERPPMAAR
mgnify:CR=1 FL=1